jgi:hypothetical protein
METDTWEDASFNIRVKDLCKPCNNEWCNEIETDAQPVLMPLILGNHATPDASEQTTLAIWAIKTVLMLQMTHKDNRRSVAVEDFHWFRQHRWPLPNEQIWIAHYDGTGDWPVSYHHYGFLLYDPATTNAVDSPDNVNGHVVALSVGHLVFVAFGHTIRGGPSATPSGPIVAKLRQIWPTTGAPVDFPLRVTVAGNDGLRALVDAFGDAERFRNA